MRIALVVHDFDPGLGQGRYCVELARRFAPRHEVTVYANTFAVPLETGWRFERIPALRWNTISLILTFLAAAEPRVRRGGHDLIHCQGLTSWSADVITAHICNKARYQAAPPTRLRSKFFPAIINPAEEQFYRQKRARAAIAVSGRVADELRRCYGWARPCAVIHHGVDIDDFRPPASAAEQAGCRRTFGLPEQGRTWLFVGEAVKGLSLVMDRLPEFPGARLLVISRSRPEPYVAEARRLGVADRFHFWGPAKNMADAYRAADLFVYPSNYDTFGMVVLEALATGLPVIAGKEIGAAELIESGRNGYLVDPARGSEIGDAIRELEGCAGRMSEIGAAARNTALGRTWDACAQATEEVYRRVLAERSSGR